MRKQYNAPVAAISVVANDDICTISSAASGKAMQFELDVENFN